MGSVPGLGRSPGGGHGNPLQHSYLKNIMDRGAWWATIHRTSHEELDILKWETLFLGAPNHCRWWLQSWNCKMLAPWRKAMTNLDGLLKSRDITLSTKVHIVKAMVFPVVMYGCESWTIKKAECQRNDAFELWCWRRFLRVPWTARKSNQSILKEISPEYLLEGLMLKLKLQYLATWCEELTHWKRPWCSEGLRAGEVGVRGWDG